MAKTVKGQATLEGGVVPAADEQDIIDRRAKQSGFNLTATGQDAPLTKAAEKSKPKSKPKPKKSKRVPGPLLKPAAAAHIKTVREAQGAAGRRLDDRLVNAKTAPRRPVTAEHLAIHRLWLRDPGAADIQGIDTKRFDAPVKVDKKTLAWALNAGPDDPLPTYDPSGRMLSMGEVNAIAKLRGKKPDKPKTKKRDLVSTVRELETVTNQRDQLTDLIQIREDEPPIHRPAGYIGVTDQEFLNLVRSKYGGTRGQGETIAAEHINPYSDPTWFENMELEPEEKESLRSGAYKTIGSSDSGMFQQYGPGQTITSLRKDRKELNLDIKDLEREIGRHYKGGFKEFQRQVAKFEAEQRKPKLTVQTIKW